MNEQIKITLSTEMTVSMLKLPKSRCFSIPVVTLALALLGFVFGGPAFALPTIMPASGHTGGFHQQPTHGDGPSLSSGFAFWNDSYDENADEEWHGGDNYDNDCDDGYGDYDDDGCENGHDGDDDGNTSPVPEPASALLMSLGLAGAAYLKRRRK